MELTKKLWGIASSFFTSLGGFLKGLGGTLTAVAVTVVGIYGSDVLDRSRARDSDAQLYAQLMSKREDAETLLRKDMFNSIIGTFLKTSATGYPYEQQVLNLELLAYNFHEALDLAPLFKHVYMDISNSKDRHTKWCPGFLPVSRSRLAGIVADLVDRFHDRRTNLGGQRGSYC
jgi:hypothetical protein